MIVKMDEQPTGRHHRIAQTVLAGGVVLLGFFVMGGIARAKRRPAANAGAGERALRVDGYAVVREDCPVTLTGYGTVQPRGRVALAAEVPGIVTNVHASLRVGAMIGKGEVLFAVDDRDYRAAVAEAEAALAQSLNTIERLRENERHHRRRLATLQRNLVLATREYDRARDLLETHKIGSQTELDLAEQAHNTVADLVAQLEQLLAVAPLGIREAETGRAVAESHLARAQRQVERCRTRAPFSGRVVRTTVELGQFVSAAAPPPVVLADDAVLELRVPLDAREAYQRMQFERDADDSATWFARPRAVDVSVRWTEAPDTHQWTGTLHRVEELSATTRMLTVVIRVERSEATNDRGFPMVEGMFCSVAIPGLTLNDVYRVPRWAVTVDRAVYKVVEGRLVTQPIHMVHTVGDVALIDKGLSEGDVVIVTRLSDPLENRRVDLKRVDAGDVLP